MRLAMENSYGGSIEVCFVKQVKVFVRLIISPLIMQLPLEVLPLMKLSVGMMVIETGPGLWEFQKVLSLIFVWCFFWPGVVYFQELLILICLKYFYAGSLYNDADIDYGKLKHKVF